MNRGSSLENLRALSGCPICGGKLSALEATVLAERDGQEVVHVICRRCGVAVVNLLLHDGMGISTLGVVTDASAGDLARVRGQGVVTNDDVLAMHRHFVSRGA